MWVPICSDFDPNFAIPTSIFEKEPLALLAACSKTLLMESLAISTKANFAYLSDFSAIKFVFVIIIYFLWRKLFTMSFVGYIPDEEEFEKSLKREKERWAKMTPEERKEERDREIKVACIIGRITLIVILAIIAFFAWILLSY
jgi:hypothetical protein